MGNEKDLGKSQEGANRLDLKGAVKIAIQYFTDLYPQFALANLLLEEVEESENRAIWTITLGYDVKRIPEPTHPSLEKLFTQPPPFVRKYKIITIDAKTGRVISMKIRELD